MLAQMSEAKPSQNESNDFIFEKLLHTGDWKSFLNYSGILYQRPENGKYARWTS